MTAHVSFEVAVPSVTKWAAEIRSPLVNDLLAAHFAQCVTINVDWTVTANDTRVVIRPSRIQ